MSDVDKAVRAELETGYWRLSRKTSTAADKGATAIIVLLDWATAMEADPVAGSDLLVRTLTRQVRDHIAAVLGVSGEDRSEPTPAPRQWRDSAGDLWREKLGEPPTLVVLAEWNGRPADPNNGPLLLSDVKRDWGPLSEVVTPEGPA